MYPPITPNALPRCPGLRLAVKHTVTFCNASTTRPVHSDRVDLIEVSHCAEILGDIAKLSDRSDVTIHQIDRYEADHFRALGRQRRQDAGEVVRVIMPEDVLFDPAIANARNHGSVVERNRYDGHARDSSRQCRKRRFVGNKARGEDQRRFAPVQVGNLSFEPQMEMDVAGEIARTAAAGTVRLNRCDHRLEHRRMLTRAKTIVEHQTVTSLPTR